MTGTGHLISGGLLATAVPDGLGVQDRRQFRLSGLWLPPLIFISTVFVGFIFVDANAPFQADAEI